MDGQTYEADYDLGQSIILSFIVFFSHLESLRIS